MHHRLSPASMHQSKASKASKVSKVSKASKTPR
jgi:hypothetical protein